MKRIEKNHTGGCGFSENVHKRANNPKSITVRPPNKAEACIAAFLKRDSLNTFEANSEYGDTCLHTCVSDLNRKFGLVFARQSETIVNRTGRRITVKRYRPADIEHMKLVLAKLRKARGVNDDSV